MNLYDTGQSEYSKAYSWATSSVTTAGSGGDVDITNTSAFANLFANLPQGVAHRIKIIVDGTTYVRLNSTTNDKMTLGSTVNYTEDHTHVEKIYLTTGGAAVNVTIILK